MCSSKTIGAQVCPNGICFSIITLFAVFLHSILVKAATAPLLHSDLNAQNPGNKNFLFVTKYVTEHFS